MIFSILGRIMHVVAALLLLPLAVALLYREDTILAFLLPIGVLMLLGTLLSRLEPRHNRTYYARDGFITVALAWILISLFGALPFWLSGEIPSFVDSFFETVSGFTTTGASILTDVEALSHGMLFWRSFTHWVGGMGVLVFVLAVMPKSEGNSMHLMRAEVPGPTVGKLVSQIRLTARILYGIYIAMTALEVLLLCLGGMPVFDSLVNAFGTAGTGGFAIKNASIGFYNSAYVDGVITVFMILFGINFNVFYFLIAGSFLRALRSEELHWYLGIIAVSIAAITLNIGHLYDNLLQAFRYASFQVASIITTTGFATADYTAWPEFSQGILLLLMFFGACAGSTGGGLKTARLVIMVKSGLAQIRHLFQPRSVVAVKFEGKRVEESSLNSIHTFFIVYMMLFSGSVLLLSLDHFDFATTFSAVAACINNIGPGIGLVGPTGNYSIFSDAGKLLLSFNMLAGRLEIFPILMLFLPPVWKRK
nr:TrkH family potassium uptake protein [Ligaoa zhengdingensis]